jgi:hypothetical protein
MDTQAGSNKYSRMVSFSGMHNNISGGDESFFVGFVSYSELVYGAHACGGRFYLCKQDDTRPPDIQKLGFPEKRGFQHETP